MELIHRKNLPTHLSRALRFVLDFLESTDLNELEDGKHLIQGEGFFVNIFRYTTASEQERIWEAHREYIDIQMVIEGEEICQQAFSVECTKGVYEEDKDFIPITLNANTPCTRFVLNRDKLAVFYPEDAHQTGVSIHTPCAIRKAVFKLAITP